MQQLTPLRFAHISGTFAGATIPASANISATTRNGSPLMLA